MDFPIYVQDALSFVPFWKVQYIVIRWTLVGVNGRIDRHLTRLRFRLCRLCRISHITYPVRQVTKTIDGQVRLVRLVCSVHIVCLQIEVLYLLCPFVGKETNGSYPFGNGLNGLCDLCTRRSVICSILESTIHCD